MQYDKAPESHHHHPQEIRTIFLDMTKSTVGVLDHNLTTRKDMIALFQSNLISYLLEMWHQMIPLFFDTWAGCFLGR